jgi:putative heme transporter
MRLKRLLARRGVLTGGGGHLTALVCFLAFVAVGNCIGSGVRVALGGHRMHSLALVINLLASGVLSALAVVRVRAQRRADPADADTAPAPAIALKPAEQLSRADPGAPTTPRIPWRRTVHAIVAVAFVAAAVITIVSQWGTLDAAVAQLGHVHWRTLRWALYAEILALIAFAQLTRLLLRAGGVNLGLGSMFRLTLASNALALTLPGGPAWAVTFSVDQLRRRGVGKSLSVYAFVLTWLMSAIALVVVAVVGIDVAGDVGPASRFQALEPILTAGICVLAVVCVLLVRLQSLRARAGRLIRRLCPNSVWGRIEGQILAARDQLSQVRMAPRLLVRCIAAALLNWIYDCAALVLSILAVGGHVPWQGVLAAYALTQLSAAVPITPGGVGVVEGTLSLMLIACHMPAATAIAAVLLYRIISFWLLVPIGWGIVVSLLAKSRRRTATMRTPVGVAP